MSVIIPTFNRVDRLEHALNSVYNQTLSPDEVFVIDDGSLDHTHQMINQYFPNVIYIHQSNQGVSIARNTGIQKATGEWFAFLDSDDEWLEDKLFQQITALKETNYKICHTEEIWIRNGVRVNQKHKHKKTGGWIFERCLPLCAMSPSSILIHRDVFKTIGNFDPDFPACEDYELWLRITARYPVLFIDTPQIKKYGGHDDQLSQKYWGMDRFRIKALEKIIKSSVLSSEQTTLAIDMLIKKAKIVQQGALKRHKKDDVESYQQLIDMFESTHLF
ncbi:MAG: glycosyltransferase family 2 protein [Methylococcales bacterium]|nr:glycosyltransferase family 2 protein [Methylococcales bacterium]